MLHDNYTQQLLWAVSLTAGFFTARYLIRLHRVFVGIGYLPGDKTLIGPKSIVGMVVPHIPLINRGHGFPYRQKYEIFKKYNADIISRFSIWPYWFALYVADAEVARTVTSNRVTFPKPVEDYKVVNLYGTNVVTAEGDEWKLHRRITAPSFNERNNKMVCEEATRLVTELFALWSKQGNGARIEIEDPMEMTTEFALMVIAAAGNSLKGRVPFAVTE
ncbi:hypothetical protein FRC17_005255 [Serendipita sp. 399]|nr:hypothetical protein FRC17_005255 [Serendipita sp. 399]